MRYHFIYLLLPVLALGLLSCGSTTAEADSAEEETITEENQSTTMPDPVFEIAVRKVKEGQLDAFTTARSAFIAELKKYEAAEVDREFASFYALPEPDDTEVFIGMTRWHSAEDAGKVAAELMSKPEAGAFMSTLDFKAYVMVQPIEGPDFDLATLAAQPGQVLEVAVRSVNEGQEQVFDQTRKAFVNLLSEQEGALESYEFEVVSENEDRLTVGMTVYESQEAFQRIAGSIMSDQIATDYFATFTPVALQYAVSTTNQ